MITETQFAVWRNQGYNRIPLMKKLGRTVPVPLLYEAFADRNGESGLLETGRAGRWSYIPFHRLASIRAKNGRVVLDEAEGKREWTERDPLYALEELMNRHRAPRLSEGPDWKGGALGFLSYDLAWHFERLPHHATDDLGLPDLCFTLYRDGVAVDHREQVIWIWTHVYLEQGDDIEQGLRRLDVMEQKIMSLPEMEQDRLPVVESPELPVTPSWSQEEFEQAVLRVQEYIRAGDTFQVNLSVRQDFPLPAKAWNIYRTLRLLNPSPYMAFLHYPDFDVVCGSPELLLKFRNGKLSTRPIAGTRPRGANREEDLRLARELIENEKERAEHIMLVDLERNDLGRVCRPGSVHVPELMVIEEYSHVMHIVSHVEGELATNKTIYDAIRACFPGGTITGAPKIRTMEIIEELEPVKRGLYTGSIGWIGFDGDLELNIVIRTLLAKGGTGYVQAGAGIVIDSRPDAEYRESLKKAEALILAARLSRFLQGTPV
jgi:para-aminobenzoate synthetase component 1